MPKKKVTNQVKRKKKDKSIFDLIKIGLVLLFVSLTLASVLLYKNYNNEKNLSNTSVSKDGEKEEKPVVYWETYANDEYSIKFSIPKLLVKSEYVNQGGYDLFVRFEENQFSVGKGVGLGITGERTRQQETDKLVEELGEPSSTSQIKMLGQEATKLDYEANGENEARSIVVFSDKINTFSISTTPDQIDEIMLSFNYLGADIPELAE